MLLINPYRFSAPRSADADVNSYILAVEAADGQQLEPGVITAIENFVLGCKSDGIWSAIKASCILAGARTLSGALVPLVGAAPTNNNFVSADYTRKTGLKGNASTKYLNSNRFSNAESQNSIHLAIYVNSAPNDTNTKVYIGANNSGDANQIFRSSNNLHARNRSTSGHVTSDTTPTLGFIGSSRGSSSSFISRRSGANSTITSASTTPTNFSIAVFATNNNGASQNTDARISFYSIGANLNLSLLDSRVSTLMTDLVAAI